LVSASECGAGFAPSLRAGSRFRGRYGVISTSRAFRFNISKRRPAVSKRKYTAPSLEILECRGCGAEYQVPWSFAIIIPGWEVVELCSCCSRRIRYSKGEARRKVAIEIVSNWQGDSRRIA
jgi:hypothetical protein